MRSACGMSWMYSGLCPTFKSGGALPVESAQSLPFRVISMCVINEISGYKFLHWQPLSLGHDNNPGVCRQLFHRRLDSMT